MKRVILSSVDSDEVDSILSKYIENPEYRFSLSRVFNSALDRYANDSPLTVYRGLNFETKDEYINFIQSIKDGYLEDGSVRSWTVTKDISMQFASSRPSYMEYMSKSNWESISKQSKEHERITGYRGVILSTRVASHTCVDLRKFSNGAESEVLLPPGRYKVEIEEVLSYKDLIGDDVSSYLERMKDNDAEWENKFEYIKHHLAREDFSDAALHKVYQKLWKYDFHYECNVHMRAKYKDLSSDDPIDFVVRDESGRPVKFPESISLTWNIPENVQYLISWFNDADKANAINQIKKCAEPAIKEFFETCYPFYRDNKLENANKLSSYIPLTVPSNFSSVVSLCNLSRYVAQQQRWLGSMYNEVNSKDRVDQVNHSSNKKEAMEAYKSQILNILSKVI